MREDPSFFVDVVGDWSEQSSTKILSETRKVHPDLTSALKKQNFWNRTIISAINEIHENLIMWDIVSKRIDIIMHMEDQDEEDDDDDDEFEELRSRLRRLCPQLFGPNNEDQEADSIALKTWTKDAGILALFDLKMIASPSHAGNKFLRLGYLGDSAQLPYPVN
jgi:hypothetical protein